MTKTARIAAYAAAVASVLIDALIVAQAIAANNRHFDFRDAHFSVNSIYDTSLSIFSLVGILIFAASLAALFFVGVKVGLRKQSTYVGYAMLLVSLVFLVVGNTYTSSYYAYVDEVENSLRASYLYSESDGDVLFQGASLYEIETFINEEGPGLVLVGRYDCKSCKKAEQILTKALDGYNIQILTFHTDVAEEYAADQADFLERYGIDGVPFLIGKNNGRVVASWDDPTQSIDEISQFLENYASKSSSA